MVQQPGPDGKLYIILRLETATGETFVTLDAAGAQRLGQELVDKGTAGSTNLILAK